MFVTPKVVVNTGLTRDKIMVSMNDIEYSFNCTINFKQLASRSLH